MKSFTDMIKEEKESLNAIYALNAKGNFYNGKQYEQSLSEFFVMSTSPEEAMKLAKNNINVITDMFKKKKLLSGKTELRKNEQSKITIAIAAGARKTALKRFKKALSKNNQFGLVSI